VVRYKGKDQIEFGHKNYDEANYGGSPGATPTTLYRVGYVTELTPLFDPELNRVFVLRDSAAEAGRPIAILSRKENVGLRITWLQGLLGDFWQKFMLAGKNFFAEAKVYRDASNQVYLFWTGLKMDVLTVRCSVGEPITWSAELIGKSFDSKDTTIHSYGSSPGPVWEWDDAYVQKSENDTDWLTLPEVTDWEFRIDNRLKPNFSFNETGSKQLKSLEEMEQICSARLTMSFQDRTYLDYLVNQTELYLKLNLPSSQWIKLNKGKLRLVEPVLKPEDLIACRLEFEGAYVTHSFV
jgi:hypothetical protein